MDGNTSLLALLALGAVHGINPAMGWLFAVGLGLQQQDRRAVWRALAPMGLGHALAVGVVVGLAALLGLVVPPRVLKWGVAAVLVAFGVLHLVRHRHPGRGGMRVNGWDLTLWSFLMASAHGAGLMALPFAMGAAAGHGHSHAAPALAAGLPEVQGAALAATLVHTAGYLLVTGLVAVVVYEKVGIALLRRVWINLNLLWAGALIVTGVLTPLL